MKKPLEELGRLYQEAMAKHPNSSHLEGIVRSFIGATLFPSDDVDFFVRDALIARRINLVIQALTRAMEAKQEEDEAMSNGTVIETLADPELPKEVFNHEFLLNVEDTFEDNLAQALLELCSLCAAYYVDLDRHVAAKLRYLNL